MDKYKELFKTYPFDLNNDQVKEKLSGILSKTDKNKNKEVFKLCFSCIDLTALNVTDTEESIVAMAEKVNQFKSKYPEMPDVAAVCVYPALVPAMKSTLKPEIPIASVAAGFPASQTFIEVKIAETAMAVMEGAGEIDVVIPVGKFMTEKYEEIKEEIEEIKSACGQAHLKVIIESGALLQPELIQKASVLSMASGADFIKTSTGKIPVAATPEAAYVMCYAIKEWHEKTGEKIGFKAAGGIVTTDEAVTYYTIVREILGDEWLNNKLFRIGASRLANNLLSSVYDKDETYF